jgi:ComB4 competence protein
MSTINYPKSLYNKLLKIPKITSMFPLLYQKSDSVAVCKNGALVSIIEIQGVDYTGMREENYHVNFMTRKRMFERDNPFITIDIASKKIRAKASTRLNQTTNNDVINMMNRSWKKNFNMVYRTKHYVIVTINNGGMLEKIGRLVSSDYRVDKDLLLSDTINELLNSLQEYCPKLLVNDELSSYFATLLTGRESICRARNWDEPLADHAIDFDGVKNYCVYGRHTDAVYSAWLSISRYPSEIDQNTLERIFKLPVEFNVYQSFHALTKSQAIEECEDRAKELQNWGGSNTDFEKDLVELSDSILADKLTMVYHSFAIEVFGSSRQSLEDNVRLIRNAITSGNELKVYRETTNIEALFWSRFPTRQNYNLRSRKITSENSAHLASFNCVGEGFDSCGFGHRPITLFKTIDGGQYSFTFHQTAEVKPDILGHTLVLGGTSSGKTTLISFLVANCLSYPNFKAICFDRLGGLKAFTEVFGGDYLDFPDDVKMNPFLMNDTEVNRLFLFNWLKRLAKIDENDNKFNAKLNDIVKTNFELNKEDRGFDALEITLGRAGDELYQHFSQWLPNGSRSSFFNAERDSFNFEKQIVTFDATYILDQPEVLSNVTDYIFHKIMTHISDSVTPHVLWFDESPRYFQEPPFAKRMIEGLKELRKKSGVVVLSAQDASSIRMLPNSVGGEILNALAHIVLYPNRSAERADYIDFLGLNEKEFQWIKESDPFGRKVLVKQRSTESSVILDVNLASLNDGTYNLLNAFNSSSQAVNTIKRLKAGDSINWKLKYLKTDLS